MTYCVNNPEQQTECSVETCPCCGGLGVAARCPTCHGAGAFYVRTLREAQLAHGSQFEKCTTCNGAGWFPITVELYNRMGFGGHSETDPRVDKRPPRRAA